MRRILAFSLLFLVTASSANSQPTVFYDNNSDSACNVNGVDEAIYGWSVEHYFSVSNPTDVQTSFRCVLHIYTGSGRSIYFVSTRFLNGFDTLFGSTPSVHVNGTSDDLVVTIDAGAIDMHRRR